MKREELLANLDVGATVKRLRERKGLSQEELAKGICDRTNITKLENGYSKLPSLSFVLLICDRLEITIEQFLNFATNSNYSLDKKRLLEDLIYKNYEDLDNYISNVNFELLSNIDQKYYTYISGLLSLVNGKLTKGKEALMSLINKNSLDHIGTLAYHELLKYNCISKKNNTIYNIEFIQKIINKNSKNEYLYLINDLLEESIKEGNISYSKTLLEKEIQFINSHDLYKYLPIYYRNKIKLFSNNERLVKEMENKLFAIQNNKAQS